MAVAGIAIAVVALFGPWWVVTGYTGATPLSTMEYAPLGWTSTFPTPSINAPHSGDYGYLPHMGGVFLVAAAMVIAGLGSAVGMVVLAARPVSRPSPHRRAAMPGFLGSFLTLGAAVECAILLPGAANQDAPSTAPQYEGFWGSVACCWGHVGGPLTWGAGWGWYLVLAAAVLFLLSGPAMLKNETATITLQLPP